ncbi:uncharacterized protein [Musca autumnalis]|uniref:uncharacterized protein n=1 Tax=Musca autumnalis TaxID=221902 RepID=UPI003CE9B6F8
MVKPHGGKPAARRAANPSLSKSKAKSHRPLYSSTSMSNLPTCSNFNRFSSLSDLEDMEYASETNIKLNTPKSTPKPPPIITDSRVCMREIQLITGDDCVYKRTSIGTKMFPQSQEKYEFCIKALKEALIEFHTFKPKGNKLYTIFLYGLPKVNTNDIIDDLNKYNLPPTSVTEVQTKLSNANDAVYKVQFDRKSFNPSHLKNIKTICKIIITWKKHKPKKADRPTQCWNCLMYGHGGDHCNRKPACMTCAKLHKTSECPLTKDNNRPPVFSCFNCKQAGYDRTDHAANDIKCPLRQKYLDIRLKVTTNQSRRATIAVPRHTVISNNNNINNRSYASTVRNECANIHTNNNHSDVGHGRNAGATSNECSDLFNIDELFNIFSSALDELSRCTSKVQQLQVVMSLLKYAYDFK